MKVEIKQNWSNGLWWVKPVDAEARLNYRASENDNGMYDNTRVAAIMGREWFQAFIHGVHDCRNWYVAELPAPKEASPC